MTAESSEVQAIFERWSLYEKVIRLNYMCHQQMIQVIQGAVEQIDGPLRVLDLGCGDGWMASQGLKNGSLETYHGIDLSESALAVARQHLEPLGGSLNLHRGNFLEFLDDEFTPTPNLILASYSLHHFSGNDLQWLLSRLRSHLSADDGLFVWIDIKCEPGESRPEYMDRFHNQLLPTWDSLTPSQMGEVIDHMTQSDFPLEIEEQHQLAREAGLEPEDCLYSDDYYAAHTLRRAESK
ncbi:MAG: class I SAM-dependent methyltransferase [Rubripirellula sp.]